MDYEKQIIAMCEGEMYGIHLFSLLAEREDDAEVAQMWRRVADIERLTGERLEPLASRFGANLDALTRSGQDRAVLQVAEFEGQSSTEVLEYYGERVPANVDRVTALAAQAPAEDQRVLHQFIAHSEAFANCASHWLNDDRPRAMLALDAYLSGAIVASSGVTAAN